MIKLTLGQAANSLGVSQTTLRRWCDADIGPEYIRLPKGHRRFPADSLERFKRENGLHVADKGDKQAA